MVAPGTLPSDVRPSLSPARRQQEWPLGGLILAALLSGIPLACTGPVNAPRPAAPTVADASAGSPALAAGPGVPDGSPSPGQAGQPPTTAKPAKVVELKQHQAAVDALAFSP